MYELQEAWNALDEREALFMTQYDLADCTDYTAADWSEFLADGKVSKYIDKQINTFKKAQMRVLIAKSTENDKSVGTAQMLNAIGKTLDDEDSESGFFVYSYVPLTPQECEADNVQMEDEWTAPNVIKDVEENTQPKVSKPKPTVIKAKETRTDINMEDFI